MSNSEMFIKQEWESDDEDHTNSFTRFNTSQIGNILEPEVKISSGLENLDYGFCELCQASLYLLKVHKAVFHKNKSEKRCTFCGQLFIKRSKLVKHILKIHNSSQIKCAYCARDDFKQYEELENHLEDHVFLHIYICHICQQSFALKSNLDDHLTYHLSSWKVAFLECPLCQMRFKSQKSGVRRLKQHYFEDHSKHLKCQLCGKTFTKFLVFYNHFLRHTKRLPYACEECGLYFRKHCRLKEHTETIHGNKFNFKCTICHLPFKHKPSFDAHLRSHDESVRFSCHYCGKLFLRKVSLLDHFVEKSCELCDEEFHCKSMFDRHFERNHKAERLFGCDECSRTYILENALKRHKTLMHPKIREHLQSCPLCSYVTTTKHNLNRHKRRNHSIVPK